MPRADRYMLEGYTYHLTHRCHNRASLLRFVKDREAYREWLRVGVKRYRILDSEALLQHLGDVAPASFRESYAAGIEEQIAKTVAREAAWTEGLAVGSRPFVERVVREVGRTQISYSQLSSSGAEAWCVRETPGLAYGLEQG
jgi:hypothetical protein